MSLQPPVILVHGITGSVLRDEYPSPPDEVWRPGAFKIEEYNRIAVHPESPAPSPQAPLYEAVEPARVTASYTVRIVYGELIDLLRRDLPERGEPTVPAYLFSYDWRQDNRLNAARLGDFIAEVIERTNLQRGYAGRCESVDLVGHSMGGLLIGACLAGGRHRNRGGKPRVRRVVTLATPFLGATDSMAKLATGESEIVGQRLHTEREVARLTPAIYQLLPVYADSFFDTATHRPLDLFDTASWQESIVGSLAESIRRYSTDPALAGAASADDPRCQAAALRLLEARLASCRELHRIVDGLRPDDLLLDRDGWLPIVGIDAKTRFATGLSVRTDPGTGRTRKEWDFLISESDYDGTQTPAAYEEVRLRLGDGVVPLPGAVPGWIPRERVVAVAERDFGGPFGLEDLLVRKFTSLHVTLPLMNLAQRWVLSFLKGRRWGEVWGRPLPDVKAKDWRPPVPGVGTKAD